MKQDGSSNGLADKLKEDVRITFKNVVKPVEQLELINHLQRLGLAYLFDEEIESRMKKIYDDHCDHGQWESLKEYDLHSTALAFRLLRQHKHYIPEGNFFV